MIEGYFDGACEPVNPGGNCSWGIVIKKDGRTIHKSSGFVGSGDGMTNNVGEYCGVYALLKELIKMEQTNEEIKIYGDSMMVINQMSGAWTVRDKHEKPYKKFAREAKELSKQFKRVTYKWIPREQNEEADRLSKQFAPPDARPLV